MAWDLALHRVAGVVWKFAGVRDKDVFDVILWAIKGMDEQCGWFVGDTLFGGHAPTQPGIELLDRIIQIISNIRLFNSLQFFKNPGLFSNFRILIIQTFFDNQT